MTSHLAEVGPREQHGHGVGGEDGFGRLSDHASDHLAFSSICGHREHVLLVRGETTDFEFAVECGKLLA